jgi:hypothetical protein
MEASALNFGGLGGLGTLGDLSGKAKKPRKARGTRANNPPLPIFNRSIVGATTMFNSAPPPPPPPGDPVVQEGHSTRDAILDAAQNITATIFDKKADARTGGNDLSQRERQFTARENAGNNDGLATDVGSKLGKGAGGLLDTIGQVVSDHPGAVAIAGGLVALYLLEPKSGGYKRR